MTGLSDNFWDAVVVGAGPAGSIAAREMARRGLRVLLVDKAHFPRSKVCGCCLNGNALAALAHVGLGQLPKNLGATPLTHMTLAAKGRTANISLPVGVSLSRTAFDAALIQEATSAGVSFQPGITAKLGDVIGERREVILDQTRTIAAKVVVVAAGLNHRVNSPPVVSASSRIGAGVILDHAPPEYSVGCIFMATARHGYVGLVRVEDGRLDIAAAFDAEYVKAAGGLGEAACRVLNEAGLPSIPELQDAPWKGTPPLTRHPRQIAGERWFAVGDAAGYVEPFTGEGMAWAIGGATAVAKLAAKAAAHWSDAYRAEWRSTHARLIGSRQRWCRVAARVLRSPFLCACLVRGLSLMPGLAGPFVRGLNRPPAIAGVTS